jgi:hypothetical protein
MVNLNDPFPGPLKNQTGLPGFPLLAVAGQPCPKSLRPVAAVCVDSVSVYHSMEGVIAFNQARDARNFPVDRPAVFHPPCRSWSRSYSKIAKPKPGEKELGLLCCDWLKRCGGVLEQPAHSALFATGGLPQPGQTIGHLSTIEVLQSWWGYPTRKRTWLCFSGVDVSQLELPFALNHVAREGLKFERMSQKQRSHTTDSFAAFLIAAARATTIKHRHTLSLPAESLQRCQPKYDIVCDQCGLLFVSNRQHAATCSTRCRKAKSRA